MQQLLTPITTLFTALLSSAPILLTGILTALSSSHAGGIPANLAVAATDPNGISVRLSSAPRTLEWNSATTGSESAIIQNIMMGLFGLNTNLGLELKLASRYQWSKDHITLEVELKKNIRWTTGERLTSQDFLDSFERLLNPTVNSPNASLLFDVEGAKDYFLGKTKKFSDVKISAPTPLSLKFTLKTPRANFLHILTHWATFPIQKKNLTSTLGPYQITSKTKTQIQLKAYSGYSGEKPKILNARFIVVHDPQKALKDYRSKKIDYLLQVDDSLLEKATPSLISEISFVQPTRVVALLHLNPTRVSTNTPQKRRAIMAGIPTEALVNASPETRASASSIIPAGMLGGPSPKETKSFQPKSPLAELPQSPLTLGFPNDEFSRQLAERIQIQSKTLKIKTEVLPTESEATQRYDLILTLFGLDYADPDQLLSSFLSQGTHDLFHTSAFQLIRYLREARVTQDLNKRAKAYALAAQYLQNDLAIVMPLFYRKRAYLLRSSYSEASGSRGSPLLERLFPQKSD